VLLDPPPDGSQAVEKRGGGGGFSFFLPRPAPRMEKKKEKRGDKGLFSFSLFASLIRPGLPTKEGRRTKERSQSCFALDLGGEWAVGGRGKKIRKKGKEAQKKKRGEKKKKKRKGGSLMSLTADRAWLDVREKKKEGAIVSLFFFLSDRTSGEKGRGKRKRIVTLCVQPWKKRKEGEKGGLSGTICTSRP